MQELCWQVGGAQGEGIDSTGDILSTALHRRGHYIFSYRHFMSLIKGGHTHYKIRVTDQPVAHHGDFVDLLVAFDQDTVKEDASTLRAGGLLIHDDRFTPALPADMAPDVVTLAAPLYKIAHELGNPIAKNMVAAGISAAAMGLPLDELQGEIAARFGKKGEAVIQLNQTAIERGYTLSGSLNLNWRRGLPATAPGNRVLMSGNEAAGMGATAGGCRFYAGYPITPATEIMYWLVRHMTQLGGRVVQAEDEIAALMMAIGAGYAGARAVTATSGPGLALMTEALGLAGITETPVVIFDVQRGGPSTGLPTKTEQSDLNHAVYGGTGDFPKIVLAPTSIHEMVHWAGEAFNLAERFQCPVLVLSDLYLGMCRQSIDVPNLDLPIDRGKLLLEPPQGEFLRYDPSVVDGVSLRTIPGVPGGQYVALSNEHDPEGQVEIEETGLRVDQMNKRERKLEQLQADAIGYIYEGPPMADDTELDLLLIGYGSMRGVLNEALQELRGRGHNVGHLQVRLLHPFPLGCGVIVDSAKAVLVVEHSQSGQFAGLLMRELGHHPDMHLLSRYDGDPMSLSDVLATSEEVLQSVRA